MRVTPTTTSKLTRSPEYLISSTHQHQHQNQNQNQSDNKVYPSSTDSRPKSRHAISSLALLARNKTSSVIASLSLNSKSKPLDPLQNISSSTDSNSSVSLSPSISPSQKYSIQRSTSSLRELLLTIKASNESVIIPHSPNQINGSAPETKSLLLETIPPSQSYAKVATIYPAPIPFVPPQYSKNMHQTSSRLLRMTTDDRPFTRDFKDLFATLIVSLPLASHRVRLTRIDHSFLSEEAINNLGSLKFSQSNRMPDPKDPSRIVTTTTTTTFSMAREMARSVCQRFLDARFIESADGKHARDFPMKGSVWQLTPKGIHVLERFCAKNGIQQKHVSDLINSQMNTMQLVILERDSGSDKISADRSTIEVIFRRFVGQNGPNGPNLKSSMSSTDSDSLSEYKDSIVGVRMTSERKIGSRVFSQTFTGKAATDWLLDCCTTVDRQEAIEIATLFLTHGLIFCLHVDRQYLAQFGGTKKEKGSIFQPTKNAIYQLSAKGKNVVDLTNRDRLLDGEVMGALKSGISRDSNTQKLDKILNDPALRLLFRENLRDTHCEENLSFYLDVEEFIKVCQATIKSQPQINKGEKASPANLDSIKETMASAYGIYNAFLAPGSPCELNIDHMLRNQLATRMTKAVGQDSAMIESLGEVTKLFEEAQISVFKLMATDSVPKFMKSSKYEQTLKNHDFDSIPTKCLPESNTSKST
ncbi:Developmental regulator [Podosphaera aphanis]|nr:Developmental regulator [Podosphaera aphanis]